MKTEPALKFRLPDYRRDSLVNLMTSLRQGLGDASSTYPALSLLDTEQIRQARNVVFCVIDGLGDHLLQTTPHVDLLRRHRQGVLHSVFPSTTAAAITTFLTGAAPQQHGLTGWFVNLAEAGGVTAVLPCEPRDRTQPLRLSAAALAQSYGHEPVFNRLACDSYIVSPDWIINSAFNQAHTGKARPIGYRAELHEMFDATYTAIHATSNRKYIYTYWPELDRLSHLHGQYSDVVAAHLQAINQELAAFCQRIAGTNTLLIISADHGFIDTTPDHVITINEHPQLQACLRAPLCGEPRLAYCYVKPDKRDEFVEYVQQNFPGQIDLVASSELIDRHAFGLGSPHPQLQERVGDFTLVMKGHHVVKDWLPTEKWFFHRGVHGGVSDQEMKIPLILIEC